MSGEAKLFPCAQCGAKVEFRPGTDVLSCSYCGHENAIPQSEEDIVELDFSAHLEGLAENVETDDFTTVKCTACAAEVEKAAEVTALTCPYCDSNIVAEAVSQRRIKPLSLLPFKIARQKAKEAFSSWLGGLWFAPSDLKRSAEAGGRLNGIYMPYWTYDSDATSFYTGQRGEYYYVTETYTVTDSDGQPQTRTRQVRHTRWHAASGTVWDSFDDILIPATKSLPRKYLDDLEPWDLDQLVPYTDDYLSGFRAERYGVELDAGFDQARTIMDVTIQASVRRDIGGDEQRVSSVKTSHANISFKHILLPLWISAYRYRGKVFRFFINARTGEVRGERPWSSMKIAGAVVLGLLVVGAIIFLARR